MKYYIIAGEASGDLHGSNLMKGLYARDPEADIRFWGGPMMDAVFHANQEGSGMVRDYKDGAVMGFVEVALKARKFLGKITDCKKDILAWGPDVVILIDYPGFNLKIASFARKAGIKVFYYIAPKVWASRESRIRKLRDDVDTLFIVFPFEVPYFEKKGVKAVYKGNPLIDAIDGSPAMHTSREDFLRSAGLDGAPFIALLPGSRGNELKFMIPRLAALADRLHADPEFAGFRFIAAGAPSRKEEDYRELVSGREGFVSVLFGRTYDILRHAEAAVINSGTASLEAALIGTPQVVGYGVDSRISFLIGRTIIRTPFISLGNLILGRSAFRELLQYYMTPENLETEVRRLVGDLPYRERMKADYAEIRALLGGSGASEAVAEEMITQLKQA